MWACAMSDFTKEELEYIYDELDSNYSELKNIPLMNKVKSMVDNYCDHEWITYPNDFAASPFCKKCHTAG